MQTQAPTVDAANGSDEYKRVVTAFEKMMIRHFLGHYDTRKQNQSIVSKDFMKAILDVKNRLDTAGMGNDDDEVVANRIGFAFTESESISA